MLSVCMTIYKYGYTGYHHSYNSIPICVQNSYCLSYSYNSYHILQERNYNSVYYFIIVKGSKFTDLLLSLKMILNNYSKNGT